MLDNLYPDVIVLAGGGQGAVLLPRGGFGRSRSSENRRQPAQLIGRRSGQSVARRIIKGSLKANFQAAFCGLQTFQAAIGFNPQRQPEKQNRSARCQTVFLRVRLDFRLPHQSSSTQALPLIASTFTSYLRPPLKISNS